MTRRHADLALSALFLVIGIMAAGTTFRLNSYIRETIPRDAAQERCDAQTLDVLAHWVQSRRSRDGAMDARDEATIAVLDQMLAGDRAGPEQIRAWRDAVAADRQIRLDVAAEFEQYPLPDCSQTPR